MTSAEPSSKSNAEPFAHEAAKQLSARPSRALAYARVPGESGRPLVGHTLEFLRHTQALMDRLSARHGANFRIQLFGVPFLVLGSPDAVREVFLDRDKNFSSALGWSPSIGALFARGLMLQDFEEHRVDRRIMQLAFRSEAMRVYVEVMNQQIAQTVRTWPLKLELHPAFKQLTLDMASRIFLGLSPDRDSARVNRAFVSTVAASVAIVRREVPLLAFRRGMRGRRVLERFFSGLIDKRRAAPEQDLLSQLCEAKTADGERFSDTAIRDHMIFLMMAAHDTTTSSLSSVLHLLLQNPLWQERVRAEIHARGPAPLSWDDRDALPVLDRCFDEAIRLFPPAPFIPRRTIRACTLAGLDVPANTSIASCSLITHRLPHYWSAPERFDPDRFLPERAEHAAHPQLYYPFGGGAHICLGLHFARIQVKAVLNELLGRYRVRDAKPRRARSFAAVPIPYPRDGLPVILENLRA